MSKKVNITISLENNIEKSLLVIFKPRTNRDANLFANLEELPEVHPASFLLGCEGVWNAELGQFEFEVDDELQAEDLEQDLIDITDTYDIAGTFEII